VVHVLEPAVAAGPEGEQRLGEQGPAAGHVEGPGGGRGVVLGADVDAVQGEGDVVGDGLGDGPLGVGVEAQPQGVGAGDGGAQRRLEAVGVEAAGEFDVFAGVEDGTVRVPRLREPDAELGRRQRQTRVVGNGHSSPKVRAVRGWAARIPLSLAGGVDGALTRS
jgi:hypothetical protein